MLLTVRHDQNVSERSTTVGVAGGALLEALERARTKAEPTRCPQIHKQTERNGVCTLGTNHSHWRSSGDGHRRDELADDLAVLLNPGLIWRDLSFSYMSAQETVRRTRVDMALRVDRELLPVDDGGAHVHTGLGIEDHELKLLLDDDLGVRQLDGVVPLREEVTTMLAEVKERRRRRVCFSIDPADTVNLYDRHQTVSKQARPGSSANEPGPSCQRRVSRSQRAQPRSRNDESYECPSGISGNFKRQSLTMGALAQ